MYGIAILLTGIICVLVYTKYKSKINDQHSEIINSKELTDEDVEDFVIFDILNNDIDSHTYFDDNK